MQVTCPYCSKKMILRNGSRGQFYGCSGYPKCKGTRNYFEDDGTSIKKRPPGSPEQEAIWSWLENGKENGVIDAKAGVGKAQPLTAKVLTPSGWKMMGELKVNDEIIDPDGGIGVVEEIFPQGDKETFKVTFSDNSSTECCNEHLWLTQTVSERIYGRSVVRNLEEIRKTLMVRDGKRNNHYIPMTKPAETMKKDLPLDPWLMGVFLGNGHFGDAFVLLSTSQEYIVNRVSGLLPEKCSLKNRSGNDYAVIGSEWQSNPMLDIIRDLKLDGCLASDKFVPVDYLFSDKDDRLALLQGLLDTDGYANEHIVEYTSVSKNLAESVVELVRSLGGIANISLKAEPKYTYKGEVRTGQPCFRVYISLPKDILPFSIPYKLENYTPRTKYQPYRSIASIESIGMKNCQCIKVSTKRNLYITDDYIVTHNTFTIINSLYSLRNQRVGVFSFNTHIIKDLNEKLRTERINWAGAYTFNAFGQRAIKNHAKLGNAELFQDKLDTLLLELIPDDTNEGGIIRHASERLVRLCKAYMYDGHKEEELMELVEKFRIDFNGDECTEEQLDQRIDRVYKSVPKALDLCLKRQSTYDFDDQVWWVVKMRLPTEKFDVVLVDEAQDTNIMQQELIKMVCP